MVERIGCAFNRAIDKPFIVYNIVAAVDGKRGKRSGGIVAACLDKNRSKCCLGSIKYFKLVSAAIGADGDSVNYKFDRICTRSSIDVQCRRARHSKFSLAGTAVIDHPFNEIITRNIPGIYRERIGCAELPGSDYDLCGNLIDDIYLF